MIPPQITMKPRGSSITVRISSKAIPPLEVLQPLRRDLGGSSASGAVEPPPIAEGAGVPVIDAALGTGPRGHLGRATASLPEGGPALLIGDVARPGHSVGFFSAPSP